MAMIGVPSNWRTPGIISQIIFGTGDSLAGGGAREILIVDQKLAAGAWTVNTVIEPSLCKTEAQVIAGAGAGSAIHRMWRTISAANKGVTVSILVVAPTTAGSPVAAISTFTLAGASASGDGQVNIDVAEDIGGIVTYYTGDLLADIAARVRAFINAKTYLPLSASGTAGAVTLTAKGPGTRWGTTARGTVRCRITTSGAGITVSGGGDLGATTTGADGSTTEAAQVATALAAIGSVRKYYLVYGDAGNATAVASIRSYVANSAVAIQGRRMLFITGSRDTKSAVIAIANTANYEREVIFHQAGSNWTPEQLAAQGAASMQFYQEGDATHGFVDYSGPEWLVPGAQDSNDWPDGTDISDLINNGVSSIASRSKDKTYLPMLVDTRSKDSSGAFDDFRACEVHRVSGADFVIDDLQPKLVPFKGMKLGTRPALPDGSPNLNYVFPKGAGDIYTMRGTFVKALAQWNNVHLKRMDETLASLTLTRHPTNAGAIVVQFTLYVIDHCTQIQNDVSEGSAA